MKKNMDTFKLSKLTVNYIFNKCEVLDNFK